MASSRFKSSDLGLSEAMGSRLIRSMTTDNNEHFQATLAIHTGSFFQARPSLGSWVSYGLGTENQNLPGYITIKPSLSHGGAKNWASAFLPGAYQGTAIGNSGLKVDDIKNEPIEYLLGKHFSPDEQRYELEMLQNINNRHRALRKNDAQLEARIQAFELAFRMQMEAPAALDLADESPAILRLYGIDGSPTDNFGRQCLLARRLVERGVRFVQCSHSYKWDQHSELRSGHQNNAREVDQPIAALILDLKQRGLLEDTLVLWGTEFGRTPVAQDNNGRDHNPYGFTMWLAGGGVRGGMAYGATDEFGYYAAENRVSMYDLHATLLHLLGVDHTRLTYRHNGRDFRLTDVHGEIVTDIIA